jgi:hypothetical protein
MTSQSFGSLLDDALASSSAGGDPAFGSANPFDPEGGGPPSGLPAMRAGGGATPRSRPFPARFGALSAVLVLLVAAAGVLGALFVASPSLVERNVAAARQPAIGQLATPISAAQDSARLQEQAVADEGPLLSAAGDYQIGAGSLAGVRSQAKALAAAVGRQLAALRRLRPEAWQEPELSMFVKDAVRLEDLADVAARAPSAELPLALEHVYSAVEALSGAPVAAIATPAG